MANTFILGGSPLGLVGVRSRPTRTGMSTFNGGDSRNINVGSYNLGKDQEGNIKIDGKNASSPVSLLTGGSIPNFWGNISTTGTDQDTTGIKNEYKGINRDTLHNNEVYDTSLLNIIEKLSFSPSASLRPQDFAYLKDLGVFPNNRLMIARRFSEPQKDNIMTKSGPTPMSVLISWKPEGEDFIDFTFGEEWVEADADFTNVLNNLGGNFNIGGAGSGVGKALNAVPLPGVTELIQRKLLVSLGVLDESSVSGSPLPAGNPNIIKRAKRRKTFGYGQAESGLKCSVKIKMKVEYEQKFISGIDPTIAWMDLLNNALIFGTSPSDNYGLSKKFTDNIKRWTSLGGLNALVSDIISGLSSIVESAKSQISEIIKGVIGEENEKNNEETEKELSENEVNNLATKFTDSIVGSIEATIGKYKVEILGIAHALSGLPSTPWHITVGNPLRPVFCSGDMLVSGDVKLTMGPTLAFNDLPSRMTIDFELENARPLGLQELLAKFNTGHLRVVNIRRDGISSSTSGRTGYYAKVKTAEASSDVKGSTDGASVPGATPPSTGSSTSTPSSTPSTTKETDSNTPPSTT